MNTNYVIKRAEISDFRRKVKDVITNYNNALDSLESTIKGTIDDLGMQGKSAENIKRYLTDIHINAFIKSIRSIMDTYYNNLIMFEYGYMLIDGNDNAFISHSSIKKGEDYTDSYKKEMEDKVLDTTSDIIRSISDIISLTTPSSDSFTSDIKAAKAYADNLDDNIIDYEFNHIKDCNDVKGSIYALGKLIKDLNQNKVNIELPNSVPKVINRDIDRVNDSISANTTDIDFINTGIDPSMVDSIKNSMEIKPGGIPSLNNNLVIGVEDTLRLGSKGANLIDSDYIKEHEDLLRNNLDLVPGKYIEDQDNPRWKNVYLGRFNTSMRKNACEEIATYNALITAGIKADINDFISITRAAEENGTVWGGTLGETPSSIEDYLSNYKFMDGKGNVKPAFNFETTTSNNPTIINNMGKSGKNFIASVYNNKTTIWGQIHTVNITKVGDKYYVHNGKMNGEVSKGYENLYDAIIDIQGNGMGKPFKVIEITNNSDNLNRDK